MFNSQMDIEISIHISNEMDSVSVDVTRMDVFKEFFEQSGVEVQGDFIVLPQAIVTCNYDWRAFDNGRVVRWTANGHDYEYRELALLNGTDVLVKIDNVIKIRWRI